MQTLLNRFIRVQQKNDREVKHMKYALEPRNPCLRQQRTGDRVESPQKSIENYLFVVSCPVLDIQTTIYCYTRLFTCTYFSFYPYIPYCDPELAFSSIVRMIYSCTNVLL